MTDTMDPTLSGPNGADAARGGGVRPLDIEKKALNITVRGLTPLIMHKWSEKAKAEMLAKQRKQATKGKEAKDPERDYHEATYFLPESTEEHPRYGFPTIAFKAAMVRAGTYIDFKMTYLRGAFHIDGEFVEVKGTPQMREDMVRVGQGTADIRYRPEFAEWTAVLPITYNARAISEEQLVNLVELAGFSVGVGEWRPEKDGQYGRFEVG